VKYYRYRLKIVEFTSHKRKERVVKLVSATAFQEEFSGPRKHRGHLRAQNVGIAVRDFYPKSFREFIAPNFNRVVIEMSYS